MSRRTPQFIVAAIAALALVPAAAFAASLCVQGGSGSMTASLSGTTVTVKGSVTDTSADGACVYIKAEIVRTAGHNPDRDIAKACGKGTKKSGSWTFTSYVGIPTHVDAKICRDRIGPDDCTSKRVSFS